VSEDPVDDYDEIMMPVGRFLGGVAALIWSPTLEKYLLLQRSPERDFAAGSWECITGRVNQGEGFEQALRREVAEELGIEVQVEFIIGTTHFYRGEPVPENELIGIVAFCSLDDPGNIRISSEHSAYRWLSAEEAIRLLDPRDPTANWLAGVIERAETLRQLTPPELRRFFRQSNFETG